MNAPDIILRAMEPEDADFLYDVENDVGAWGDGDTVAPYSREILRGYALTYGADPFGEGQLRLVAEDPATRKTVGVADLYDISQRHERAFVAVYVVKEERNRGYASSMLESLEKYAREILLLKNLGAKVASGNKASLHLFRKEGYREAGILEGWLKRANGFTDVILFQKKL